MSPEHEIGVERLLREEGWVRALARRLVRDASEADDLVQEAWLAARPGGRSEAQSPRSWLASVMRNAARQRARSEARRAERERAVARGEATPSASELLERLELRERIVRAVRELDEPYRTAILLRWFEGLAPREIARRRGVPRRTVHSWLARGLEQLRERLGRELGGERPQAKGGLLALLPLCRPPGAPLTPAAPWPAVPWIGALAMTANVKLATAGIVAAALAAAWLVARELVPAAAEPDRVASVPAVSAPVAVDAPEAARVLDPRDGARVAIGAESEGATEAVAGPPLSGALLRGRLVDVEDRPLGALALAFRGSNPNEIRARARSAGDGSFELECPRAVGRIGLEEERWASVLEPMLWGGCPERELVVVAAPRLELAGWVFDETGQPLPGAEVRLELAEGLRAGLSRVVDESRLVEGKALTDASGRFFLKGAPQVPGSLLVASHARQTQSVVPLPDVSCWDLEIVLGGLREDTRLIEGRVVDGEGAPIGGAYVSLEGESVRSDPDGRFRILVDGPGEDGVLWVVDRGRAPARVERRGDSSLADGAWPDPLEIVLAGEPLAIAGRVLRGDEPAAGVRISLDNATRFGTVPLGGVEGDFRFGADIEALVSGASFRHEAVESGADGSFELEGLLEREYALEVVDPQTMMRRIERVAAGAREVEIALPALVPGGRLAGRVLHGDGSPVADATLVLQAERADLPGAYVEGASLEADAEGRFDFGEVAAAVTHVYVAGPRMGTDRYVALAGLDRERLEIVIPRSCHLQVVLADPRGADAFEVRDGTGRPMSLVVHHGNLAWGQVRHDLVDGRSEALIANELAVELALYRDGVELRRVPIALVPGELTTIRP